MITQNVTQDAGETIVCVICVHLLRHNCGKICPKGFLSKNTFRHHFFTLIKIVIAFILFYYFKLNVIINVKHSVHFLMI